MSLPIISAEFLRVSQCQQEIVLKVACPRMEKHFRSSVQIVRSQDIARVAATDSSGDSGLAFPSCSSEVLDQTDQDP